MMARINDYLSSMSFSWTMVSAQDCGVTSPLHEMDITWRNNTKHYQSVTMMGEEICRYGVEMATVLRGSLEEVRKRPPISLIVCTIAPLMQDKEAIEGALVLAEAGIPVVIMSMPTMGTTAPATYAGALALGDAEIISATVLLQLAYPGAPVFHSILHAWADPRTAAYVGYPLDSRARYAPVEMAHHWGMPALGGAFGTESPELDSWQSAAEVATDPFWWVWLELKSSPGWVCGIPTPCSILKPSSWRLISIISRVTTCSKWMSILKHWPWMLSTRSVRVDIS